MLDPDPQPWFVYNKITLMVNWQLTFRHIIYCIDRHFLGNCSFILHLLDIFEATTARHLTSVVDAHVGKLWSCTHCGKNSKKRWLKLIMVYIEDLRIKFLFFLRKLGSRWSMIQYLAVYLTEEF
jgi:hypothetical protein